MYVQFPEDATRKLTLVLFRVVNGHGGNEVVKLEML